jgi:hypothetical protein
MLIEQDYSWRAFSVNTPNGVCQLTRPGAGVEQLTKKELRAIVEFIKECYPFCDLETFAQRVLSRLWKIVAAEVVTSTSSDCCDLR